MLWCLGDATCDEGAESRIAQGPTAHQPVGGCQRHCVWLRELAEAQVGTLRTDSQRLTVPLTARLHVLLVRNLVPAQS